MTGAPEPNTSDLAKWRRLAKHARRAAENPQAYVGDLATVLRAHKQVVMPPPASKESPFNQLAVLCKSYIAAKPSDRAAMTPDLKRLADRCDDILNERSGAPPPPDTPPPPPRRERADIDG